MVYRRLADDEWRSRPRPLRTLARFMRQLGLMRPGPRPPPRPRPPIQIRIYRDLPVSFWLLTLLVGGGPLSGCGCRGACHRGSV